MRIALTHPYNKHGLSEMKEPSHGLGYIAAVLKAAGHELKVLDGKVSRMSEECTIEEILQFSPSVLGISAMTPDITAAHRIAQAVKKNNSAIVTVIGGAHVTALPEATLLEFPFFDIGVVGEGENTIRELTEMVQRWPPANINHIKGLVFRNESGNIILTERRPWIEDLDQLPFPAWEVFPKPPSGGSQFPVIATRGCPFMCNFCMRLLGSRVRKRSPENVIKEIIRNRQLSATNFFWFGDETFGVDKIWLIQLLDLLIGAKQQIRMRWSANSRVNLADAEIYSKMRDAGCIEIYFGIESGNDKILSASGKGISTALAKKAVKVAKESGLKVGAFFIFGHPNETILTVMDTIGFAASIGVDAATFGRMVPYPGTEIRKIAEQHQGGYTYVSRNWEDYVKHGRHPLGIRGISSGLLSFFQVFAYLYFFLRQGRFKELNNFLRNHRRFMQAKINLMFGKILKFRLVGAGQWK